MKKQVFALALAVVMLLSFCACNTVPKDAETEVTFSRGTINGNVYTNEFADITLTIPDSMVFATDEEIASLQNLSKDILEIKDNIFESAKITTLVDVMATDSYTGCSINIAYEDLSKTMNSNMTLEQYVSISKNQLSNSGLPYTFEDTVTVTLGGETYTKLTAKVEYMGVSMTQGVYLRKVGHYMIVATLTAVNSSDLSPYEAMFS